MIEAKRRSRHSKSTGQIKESSYPIWILPSTLGLEGRNVVDE